MIELWRKDDPSHRVRCQTRSARSGGQCLRYQDHGGGHTYGPRRNEDEAEVALRRTTDEGLLKALATLTHQLHAADETDTRYQRDRVEAEILRRMKQ